MGRMLVVYESMFGNSERIARAVGEGLASAVDGVGGGQAHLAGAAYGDAARRLGACGVGGA